MFKDFREFAMRGNVVDMAVGIIIGVAFGTVINSLVGEVLMPPIGLLLGRVDFSNLYAVLKPGTTPGPYASLAQAKQAGAVSMNYGLFINTVINFLITAFAVFIVVRAVNKLRRPTAPAQAAPTKVCPFCLSVIPLKATRCSHCTSPLDATK
jgi:large conductance mechanosensitive channel